MSQVQPQNAIESDDEGSEISGKERVKEIIKRLVRTVMKMFYELHDYKIVDLIINETVVSQDRFIDHLKFDKRLVEDSLLKLKNDRIIHCKTEVIRCGDGRSTRVHNYFIKYAQFVNVVKFKMESLRKLVELMEKDYQAAYQHKCHSCLFTYSDAEVPDLFCGESLKFLCKFCAKEVKAEESVESVNAHMLVAKFNEQVGPIYDLIKSAEDYLKLE